MRILRLTATFGGLEGKNLELTPGLNVIQAPNEGGKSTWAAFLKAMLYGVDTRERGALADKNRYQPWTGTAMGGEMELEWEGRRIVLRRSPNKSGPFGNFEAVYAATGDPVPGLTAADAGETLTGVKKDVFQRTAMILQGSAGIGASADLEARVANLSAGGQEDISYTTAAKTLKDWKNRRQSSKSSGIIPRVGEELSEVVQTLDSMADARKKRQELQQELGRLDREEAGLREDLERWNKIDQQKINLEYAVAVSDWKRAKAECGPLKPHPIFGTMSAEDAWNTAMEEKDRREKMEEKNRTIEEHREAAKQKISLGKLLQILGASFGAFGVLLLLAEIVLKEQKLAALIVISLLLCVLCLLQGFLRLREGRSVLIQEKLIPVPEDRDIMSQAAAYREMLARRERASEMEQAARKHMEEIYARGGRELENDEMPPMPKYTKGELQEQLSQAEQSRQETQQELARTAGILQQMGDPEELEEQKDQLRAVLRVRKEEYSALELALEALDAANSNLREKFSPALNRQAGEILQSLTGGRWQRVELARDFTAQAAEQGSIQMHSTSTLSGGTEDQVYLSLRLALCRQVAPNAPLVLDEALCAFDDQRMERAMEVLQKMGEQRQILLFSCHRREAEWAQQHGLQPIFLGA